MTNQGLVPLAPHLSVAELIIGHGWRFQAGPISWKLVAGQTLWLQGANGSGKTTLLRVLATLKAPAAGNILWQEQDIAKQREVYRASLSWLGQADAVKANLTVAENLKSWGVNLDHPLVARFNITPLLSFWGGEISAGQRRRVALTRCLAKAAALYLLDEPLTHLDEAGQKFFRQVLEEKLAKGAIAIIASHQAVELPNLKSWVMA